MRAIQIGILEGYDLYFQGTCIDPKSVSLRLDYSTEQKSYQLLDPINGTWRKISEETYNKLVYGERKKFPGRRTK
ncbi:MAG: hypothetical protein N3D75_02370 [Candidatus Aenigmarchaeota archaeon]|nr:hypothetical protein [Candidatus Aenigmarchaeota archaeon]